MYKFLQHIKIKYRLDINDYPGLYKWSVENVAAFWEDVWRFCGIRASKPYTEVGNCPKRRCGHGIWPSEGLQLANTEAVSLFAGNAD